MIELQEQLEVYPIWLKSIFDEHIKTVSALPVLKTKFTIKIRVLDTTFEQNLNFQYITNRSSIILFHHKNRGDVHALYRRIIFNFYYLGDWSVDENNKKYKMYFVIIRKKSSSISNIKLPIIGWYQINDNLILCSYPNYTKIANGARNNYPLMFKKLKTFLNCNDDNKINNIINICMEMNH